MGDETADERRAALAARVHGCWDRLADVVSELVEVHDVPADEIAARVESD